MRWDVPVEMSPKEIAVARHLKRIGKFYVFLREVRHELFTPEFQAELEEAYGKARGTAPLPPAMLAAVTLLQVYDQVGDAEAVVTAKMDKRWQLVLGCLGADEAPFSQGVLVRFRERMIEHDLDRKLLDRTVQLARESDKFGWKQLKVALDSSPLVGAGRVEDVWNLIGRAMNTVVNCVSVATRVPRDKILSEANLKVLGAPSIKVALDIDWDSPAERHEALQRLLGEADSLRVWTEKNAKQECESPPLSEALADLQRVIAQDLEPDPDGGQRVKDGVARDRMPSLGDKEMRHGRKSRSNKFNGYKRHVAKLIGADVLVGALVLPANTPEHEATSQLLDDARRHGEVCELAIDRGYLGSPEIGLLHAQGITINCKPWPSWNRGRFTKDNFKIDLKTGTVTCPANQSAAISKTGTGAQFDATTCGACELRAKCTSSSTGRSIAIHPLEDLLLQLRAAKKTPEGRAILRERVTIEHGLANIQQIQGRRARYKGERKNTLDLRRSGGVANLQATARMRQAA